jgi:hypothetical protein
MYKLVRVRGIWYCYKSGAPAGAGESMRGALVSAGVFGKGAPAVGR